MRRNTGRILVAPRQGRPWEDSNTVLRPKWRDFKVDFSRPGARTALGRIAHTGRGRGGQGSEAIIGAQRAAVCS